MVVSSEPLSEIKRGQIEMLAVTGGAPFLAARVQLQRAERQQREGNSLKIQQKVRTAQGGVSSCTLTGSLNRCRFFKKSGGDDETRTRDLCRDSAPSFGNCLKLRGTDGYQNRALERQVTIIGP